MRSFVLVTMLCLASSLASAQPTQEGAQLPSATQYDFDDELVSGDLYRPESEVLLVRRRGARASLIEVKSSLVRELLKSVEDL